MLYVAGETNSCWGRKSLKVIDLAPPKVNLTLTRFEGPRGRVGEAGGRRGVHVREEEADYVLGAGIVVHSLQCNEVRQSEPK